MAVGGVGCKKRGAGWGGRGKSNTKKSVVRVYSGVGYDFDRGASGKTREVCVPCTNTGHSIPLSTYEDLDLIFYYSVCKCFSFPSHYYTCMFYCPGNLILFFGINIDALNLSLDEQFTRQLIERKGLAHVQYSTRDRASRLEACMLNKPATSIWACQPNYSRSLPQSCPKSDYVSSNYQLGSQRRATENTFTY